MPKRDRKELDKRNENRRLQKIRGRKGVFFMRHIENTQPETYKDVSELYDYLHGIYPNKHNLVKTQLYKKCIDDRKVKEQTFKYTASACTSTRQVETNPAAPACTTTRHIEINPVLRIPLMSATTTTAESSQTTTTTPEPVNISNIELSIVDQEINTLINELRQDPDLEYFFQDDPKGDVMARSLGPDLDVFTPMQKSLDLGATILKAEEEVGPEATECEIDRIIREEFEVLGTDLPDLCNIDNELVQ